MPLPSFRRNKSHVRRRRSHMALKVEKPNVCAKCGAPVKQHIACAACGDYKGKKVLRTKTDLTLKREEKRKKQEIKDKEKMASLKNK
ncbi:MAG: 50S ribosomal protein L32 [Parcubacteria group bacterium GW2011_GWC2_39_14]|nr:MAG: 50S ribosomal protein L32 [Parcubacteria group bacterium GW2011_GWC2_39_14]KKR53425.1 MAG: 50S ribosomal protein L32 [Parcubacteria group bacterium GW2011_GWA2_40_23]